MALGELIIEDRSKIIGQRVLDIEGPKIEVSLQQREDIKGKRELKSGHTVLL